MDIPKKFSITFPAGPGPDFECGICREFLFQPFSLECGHNFCQRCHLSNKCSLCGRNVKRRNLQVNHLLDNLLRSIFSEEYREREKVIEYHQRIKMKKSEYLVSKRYHDLLASVETLMKSHYLITVQEVRYSISQELKNSPKYDCSEILYAALRSGYIVEGPFIFNGSCQTPELPHIEQMSILGYLYLLALGYISVRQKMYTVMSSYMKNLPHKQEESDIDLYQIWTPGNLIVKIVESHLNDDFPQKPSLQKKDNDNDNETSGSDSDNDDNDIDNDNDNIPDLEPGADPSNLE